MFENRCGAILTTEVFARDGAMNYHDHIVRNPEICGGAPVFKGTRVLLRTILASLAEGDTAEEILADFPTLKLVDIQAAIAFAAKSAEEDLPVPEVPRFR
jgi:uncharacterized protein (DUF433 family)